MDRSHTEKTRQHHRKAGADMKPAGQKAQRTTKEHLETRAGGQHQRSRAEVAATRDSGAGPGQMENCRQWPMLH